MNGFLGLRLWLGKVFAQHDEALGAVPSTAQDRPGEHASPIDRGRELRLYIGAAGQPGARDTLPQNDKQAIKKQNPKCSSA